MNYYKALAITIFLSLGFISYGQNNIYIVTERWDNTSPTYAWDSVFVTSPAGIVSKHLIPHFGHDIAGHDSQLNIIFNGITTLGYTFVEGLMYGQVILSPSVIASHTWFFKQP